MSTMQLQLLQSVEGLNDVQMQYLLEIIESFKRALDLENSPDVKYDVEKCGKRKLGSMKGEKFIADGHDIDECNDEIAKMFGVNS